MKPANHMPRIYDVAGERLSLRVWDGTKDVWYPITWGELRNLTQDGQDALFRQMRELEKQRPPIQSDGLGDR